MVSLNFLVNKWLRCLKKWTYYIQKLWKKIKSFSLIYSDSESILVPGDNGK